MRSTLAWGMPASTAGSTLKPNDTISRQAGETVFEGLAWMQGYKLKKRERAL
jgi:hypothetical protein